MKSVITQVRNIHGADFTQSDLYVAGHHMGYVLEDAERPCNVKVDGRTAIPKGCYKIAIEYSSRFGREMLTLLNVPMFTGIRVHGGNSHEDTAGCPLANEHADGKGAAWGSLEKELFQIVKDSTDDWYWVIA